MQEIDLARLGVEISSFALVAWLMMQTFSKTLPALSDQFRQDLQRERESSEKALGEIARSLERLTVVILYHDSTVRGKNPETLGSTEELLRLLRSPNRGEGGG
ncbi:MAG: hypothetical protein HC888_19050 [Candidatus Competibacteraceae bacterium]|nr:hypothetical protein [Candidatus Competibacteraceae bacterium]